MEIISIIRLSNLFGVYKPHLHYGYAELCFFDTKKYLNPCPNTLVVTLITSCITPPYAPTRSGRRSWQNAKTKHVRIIAKYALLLLHWRKDCKFALRSEQLDLSSKSPSSNAGLFIFNEDVREELQLALKSTFAGYFTTFMF